MRTVLLVAGCGLLLLAGRASGAGEVESGPSPGKPVEGLKVYAVTGPSSGKEVDFAAERKDRPTVYLFVQADKWDRPMARFVKGLDREAKSDGDAYPVVAVWLTDTPDEAKEYLPRAQQSLQLDATALAVFGARKGPKDWGINEDAHLTAVVASKGKVRLCWGFQSVNETDVKEVAALLKKARDGK